MEKIRINNFNEAVYFEELDNGLKVFAVPLPNKKAFSSMLVVNYGGRDIKFKIGKQLYKTPSGIAHFLEHKMFEREDDPFKFYGKFGTDVNAATSDDYTSYYFIGNKCFNKSLSYLLNWVQTLSINDDLVKKEQGIILEESRMYKDNPSRVMLNKIKENLFVSDPIRNKVIGTDDDILSITKEQLELCYKTFYVPNNMYLIVSGNINPKNVIEIARKETKNFKPFKKEVTRIYGNEIDKVSKISEKISMNVEIPKVAMAYKINKSIFKNLNISSFELDVYLHFLINIALGPTSFIREKWIKEGLFTESMYRISEIESHYAIEFYASSNKASLLIDSFKDYIGDLSIDEESFEREKRIWIANEIRLIDNHMAVSYSILDDILDYDKFISNKIEIVKNLEFNTLLKIKKLLIFDNYSVLEIVNKRDN